MKTTMLLLELAVGIGFAFFVPVFFTAVARMNASLGFPELQGLLPKIFKLGFWFCAVASCLFLAALPLTEDRRESAIAIAVSALLSWRFRQVSKEEPIQQSETTRGK